MADLARPGERDVGSGARQAASVRIPSAHKRVAVVAAFLRPIAWTREEVGGGFLPAPVVVIGSVDRLRDLSACPLTARRVRGIPEVPMLNRVLIGGLCALAAMVLARPAAPQ